MGVPAQILHIITVCEQKEECEHYSFHRDLECSGGIRNGVGQICSWIRG